MDYSSIAADVMKVVLPVIGTDIWKSVKTYFGSKEKDEHILGELEKNIENEKLQGQVEYRLSEILEEKPELADEIMKLIGGYRKENPEARKIDIKDNKNVVISNEIKIGEGNLHVGDTYKE